MRSLVPLAVAPLISQAASLEVYPGADPSMACPIYEVRVFQGDRVEDAFVYRSVSDWDEQSYFRHKQFFESLSYTGFAFTGSVTVEVTKVGRIRAGIPEMSWRPDLVNPPPPTGVVVRPLRFGVEPEVQGWTTRFTLDRPGQYSVEFVDRDLDPSGTPLHGLMIFADPPEDPGTIPDPRAAGVKSQGPGRGVPDIRSDTTVVRFEEGVHELGPWVVPAGIRQIYLAPGAFLKGCLSIRDRGDGFVLNGRGVLSGHHLGWHARAAAGEEAGWYELPAPGQDYLKLLIVEGDHLTVDGIVLADSPFHTVGGSGTHHTWSWVKVMGWRYNNDGIPGFADSVIRHCFIRANDDAVWLYHDNLLVHDLVLWQGDNGACFQLGWNSKSARNITVRDVDVIHAEWGTDRRRNNSGLINLRLSRTGSTGPGVQEGFLFEDITVESPVATGIDLRMRKEPGEGGGPHLIRDFTFRRINLQLDTGFPFARNFLVPWDEVHGFEDLRFEHLRVNGVIITKDNFANEGRFDLSPLSRDAVSFTADLHPLVWSNPLAGLPQGLGDPTMLYSDGRFVLVGVDPGGGIVRWTSADLKSWTRAGEVLGSRPDWGDGPPASPHVLFDPVRRRFFLTFTSGSGVGLASARQLAGPWTLLNPAEPLVEGGHPSLFLDQGGHLYLVVDGVRMAAIDPGKLRAATDWVPLTATAGQRATVLKKNGLYHLFRVEAGAEGVSGRYEVARSALGPYAASLIEAGADRVRGRPFPGPDGRHWLLSASAGGVSLHPLTFDEASGLFLTERPKTARWRVGLEVSSSSK